MFAVGIRRWCLFLTLGLGCDVVRRGSGPVSSYCAASLAWSAGAAVRYCDNNATVGRLAGHEGFG